MGNCFRLVKQITPLEEQLDVTLVPLPAFGAFGLVLTLTVAFSACSDVALIMCNQVG